MRVHLIGVCGTAMAGVAVLLKESGFEVSGSDANGYPPMSTLLSDRGIPILSGFEAAHLLPRPDLVIVGNVARKDNPEVTEAFRLGIPMWSMPELIERHVLTSPPRGRTSVTIAGTHGKTTVTSMTAWILSHAGRDPGFLVGGIPLNFGRNSRLGTGNHFVIEGDEYDCAFFDKRAKFFHYNPTVAVITSLEYDHADIYPDFDSLKRTFAEFAARIPREGCLVHCADYPVLADVAAGCNGRRISFGFSDQSHVRVREIEAGPWGTSFALSFAGGDDVGGQVRLWGRHNLLNAAAAVLAARECGIPPEASMASLAEFQGVMRRFQTVAVEAGVTLIDDFAHHPTAVRETLAAARTRFPDSRIFAAFHFESNTSRRKVFEQDYAKAFFGADHVFLTFPLRKQDTLRPEEYLDPRTVLAGVRSYVKSAQAYRDMDQMATRMARMLRPGDVALGMSGRDFSPMYARLLSLLRMRSRTSGELTTAQGSPGC